MAIMFKSSKALQAIVDEYLDTISQGLLLFQMGVKNYLDKNQPDFEHHLEKIATMEHSADQLRRKIENDLYSHSLIPEHRGDVLGLIENADNLIDTAKETLNQFSVELPYVPEDLAAEYKKLTDTCIEAAEHIVKATRAFFKDLHSVNDHSHKVYFYEKEADVISDRIKRQVFRRTDLDLSQKIHLRYFALHIERLSDEAERVADRLAIYVIKRSI
jgi:predicted phosphate transport protein (TIGR00153 family)